jgi:hypothetical protein
MDAEESRRRAVAAADAASVERDDYRGQVKELQEQLKEVMRCARGRWCAKGHACHQLLQTAL